MNSLGLLQSVLCGLTSVMVVSSALSVHASADVPGVTDSQILIGQSVPLTGPASANGTALQHGILAAFKQVNDAGGILGRKLELKSYDDGYEPERTLVNYEKLVGTDKVFALLSFYGAPSTNAILPKVENDAIPLIGPISGANLTSPTRKQIFMIRANAYAEAASLVEHLVKDLGITDLGVLFQDDATGVPSKSSASQVLAGKQLKLSVSGSYKRNTADVSEAVASFTKAKPKVILMAGLPPGTTAFVSKIVSKDYRPIFLGISPVNSPDVLKVMTENKLTYFGAQTAPVVSDTSIPVVKKFHDASKSAGYPADHAYALEGYLNAIVLIEGLKKAGKDLTRESLLKGLEELTDLDLGGVAIHYSPTDHQGIDAPFLVQLKDGKLVSVKTFGTK